MPSDDSAGRVYRPGFGGVYDAPDTEERNWALLHRANSRYAVARVRGPDNHGFFREDWSITLPKFVNPVIRWWL